MAKDAGLFIAFYNDWLSTAGVAYIYFSELREPSLLFLTGVNGNVGDTC